MAQPSRTARPQTDAELSIVDGLVQLSFLVHNALERHAADHELSMVQTRLLGVLRDRQPTMNELAKLLALDKSSITGLIDRAERRGLVERVPSTTDRRAVRVNLTVAGRAVVRRVAARFEADVNALLQVLPAADRRTLSGVVSRVVVANATAHVDDRTD